MNLNSVIKHLVDTNEIQSPPENIRFRTYDIMVETAKNKNWTYPSKARCNEVWTEIEPILKAQEEADRTKLIEENEVLIDKMLLKNMYHIFQFIKGDITKTQLASIDSITKMYNVCKRLFG